MKILSFILQLFLINPYILKIPISNGLISLRTNSLIFTQDQFYEVKNLDNFILGFDLSKLSENELLQRLKFLEPVKKTIINSYDSTKVDTIIILRDKGIEIRFFKRHDLHKIWLDRFIITSDKIKLYKGIHIGMTKKEIENLLPGLKINGNRLALGEIGPTSCELFFSNDILDLIKYQGYID